MKMSSDHLAPLSRGLIWCFIFCKAMVFASYSHVGNNSISWTAAVRCWSLRTEKSLKTAMETVVLYGRKPSWSPKRVATLLVEDALCCFPGQHR